MVRGLSSQRPRLNSQRKASSADSKTALFALFALFAVRAQSLATYKTKKNIFSYLNLRGGWYWLIFVCAERTKRTKRIKGGTTHG